MARPLVLVLGRRLGWDPGPRGQVSTPLEDGWRRPRPDDSSFGPPTPSSLTRVSAHYFQNGNFVIVEGGVATLALAAR